MEKEKQVVGDNRITIFRDSSLMIRQKQLKNN